MGLTRSDIVKRNAKPCACRELPVWVKISGKVLLACPTLGCELYLSVKGSSLSDAIEKWNKEVDLHDTDGKRH